jgi:hypothetical protein
MTVRELTEILKDYPGNTIVWIRTSEDTKKNISRDDFTTATEITRCPNCYASMHQPIVILNVHFDRESDNPEGING